MSRSQFDVRPRASEESGGIERAGTTPLTPALRHLAHRCADPVAARTNPKSIAAIRLSRDATKVNTPHLTLVL